MNREMVSKSPPRHPCSGVILAGGLSIRFHRRNKALAVLGEEKLLENGLRVLRPFFDEILLVTKTPLPYVAWDLRIVTDIFPVQSPLAGIYTGLFYAANPHVFVTACDIPFLQSGLVETVLDNIDSRADIVLPVTEKGMEPLCAVYSKRCLSVIEAELRAHLFPESASPGTGERKLKPSLKIRNFFDRVRVKTVNEDQIRAKDPNLLSFFNVNTPEDLNRAIEMLADSRRTT